MFKKISALCLVTLLFSNSLFAKEFTSENMFYSYLKLNDKYDYEKYSNELMKAFRRGEWDKYRNDEFEFNDKKSETIQIVKEKASQFSLDSEYTINTTFKFKDYDFASEAFPLESLTKDSYYFATPALGGVLIEGFRYEASNFFVFFENTDAIGNLTMPKDVAKNFLKNRKKGSYINREVSAELKFKIRKLGDEQKNLIAELTSVEVFDDENQTKLLKKFL